jgi:plastocyanin
MVTRRYWIAAVLMALALVLTVSACTSAAKAGPSTTLDVQMTDFAYSPTSFAIPAGKEITLNLKNNGKVPHEFVIIKRGEKVTLPFDDDDEAKVYWEQEAKAGETVSVKFTAPSEPGTYDVVCGQPSHMEAGMVSTLTVSQ